MPELDLTTRLLTWLITTLMTLTAAWDLGLTMRVFMFEYVRLVTRTSSCVLWYGRGRRLVELTEGSYIKRYSQGVTRVNKLIPVSLRYLLSHLNKNFTLLLSFQYWTKNLSVSGIDQAYDICLPLDTHVHCDMGRNLWYSGLRLRVR